MVNKISNKPLLVFIPVLLLAIILRAVILAFGAIQFNADEAVVGLMARHILQGEIPVFFWGQAYMGSLDALLVAGGFLLFGQQIWVIRIIQIFLNILLIVIAMLIARNIDENWLAALFTGLLLAVPPVNTILYSTASLGGYGEAVLLGCLSILLAISLPKSQEALPDRNCTTRLVGSAFLTGLTLWANALGLVFCVPATLFIAWLCVKKSPSPKRIIVLAGVALTGFIVGSLPWWVYASQHGMAALIHELLGGAVAVETSGFLQKILDHLGNFLLLGVPAAIGLRPPWNVEWIAIPLIPVILLFWGRISYKTWKQFKRNPSPGILILIGSICLFSLLFLFTSFGVDPSGRYFIVLFIPLAIFGGIYLASTQKWAQIALLTLLLGYQLWGTVRSMLTIPPGITTQFYAPTIIDHRYDQELIRFLKDRGETRGYTTYWVAYPLAFQSQEELIFVPRLPYHDDMRYTERDDRYPPYDDLVDKSDRIAYITAGNETLDQALRQHFIDNGVDWEEVKIGDYRVYYQLSRAIRPQEFGLGVTNDEN